ncbi:MAG: glycine--tRNA ligase subunit beta [Rhodobacteraceae bacterium]|nr:glycine--tRNA ligase subunit beta [Paracoccaceae bacterium]QEW19345.1 Glycine--tRNA ligase beta subunit [Marinibacterium anthonyi]
MPDLLIELFSEEIPARMQARAAEELKKRMTDGLVEAGLTYAGAAAYVTPRRLALAISGLTAESPTLREERKGPKVGAPEKAIEGFLRGAGLTRDDLEERDTPKGAVYFAIVTKPGRKAEEIIAEVLETTVRTFSWPKSMRWGAGSLRWVRPLHSILCLLSDEGGARVVEMEIDGIKAGNTTEGHRFLAPGRFSVTSFEDYEAQLKRRSVILNADERGEQIWHDATNMAFANGLEVIDDKGLLAEVSGLVEFPVVLMGEIGEDFLDLPPEVLQTSMKEHQKFFSVRNPRTGRIERFITVANRTTSDHGATILAGNQKVLAARLSDAKFFWENDLRVAKADIMSWVRDLENVTFHNKMGSQGDRIRRIASLSHELADITGADAAEAQEAAELAKADLSSEMVYEFPELQGLMGRYYIAASGRSDAVAAAAQHHYSPLGPSDDVPTGKVSVTVALADKLDMLAGFWAIDEKPTGSKDPFALRRAALGVIRLILENDLRLQLREVTARAFFPHALKRDAGAGETMAEKHAEYARITGTEAGKIGGMSAKALTSMIASRGLLGTLWDTISDRNSSFAEDKAILDDLLGFIHDRLKVVLREKGIRHDIIDACIEMPGSDDLTLLVKRAEALDAVLKTEDGENLLQGFKRANNILTQAEEKDGVEYSFGADPRFAQDAAEAELFEALDMAEASITPALKREDFADAMSAMAGLRGPVDAFFEAVQVNTDNQTVRRNRLNLLSRIRSVCISVADLTRIDG